MADPRCIIIAPYTASSPRPPLTPLPATAVSPSIMRETSSSARKFTHAHRQRLERAIDLYLRWCYRHKTAARTSELAARLDLVPRYLGGIAKQIFGKDLYLILREKQLQEAEHLLRDTPLPVKEVALRAAFGTRGTFYRWFLGKHHITPPAYRRKVRK